jgi:pantoate--beta-alanine ligase
MSREGASPAVLRTPAEMRAWRRRGPSSVAFVPTMGALHEGHAELLRRARGLCERVVLSVFVNPAQFGPQEDLSRYPRTWEADLALARREGVDAVYFPSPEQMYPPGYSTWVEESSLSQPLCGRFRPGHFRGVTTVVLKLFNAVEPERALFGLKDAQQFFVLERMARDLDLPVSVEGVPTVREPDGLALSSRNRYLSAREREAAPALYAELRRVAAGAPLAEARARLEASGFRVQYLECRELPGFGEAAALAPDRPTLIAVAAHLGTTRLIDNVILRPELLTRHGIRIHS